ncbi:hypothetical protein MTO96_004493 [Rhipicephalus appendiculatus]
MVDGETITHEEASALGWIDAIRRRATSSATTTGNPAGARSGALRTGAAMRVAAGSPEVAWITPNLQTTEAYAKVRAIVLMERAHPVSAYIVASGTTSRGVVRGVDADLPDSELQRLFVSSHNTALMVVRRIEDTTTIILLFDGLNVPNYVRCGMLLLRCTLYKRQIDTCRNCGRVGHLQDGCPTPPAKVCEHCGIKPTGPDHERWRNNNQQTQRGSAKQQPTPKQPAPTPPTKHLPTTTKSPTATPTWADRVAGKDSFETTQPLFLDGKQEGTVFLPMCGNAGELKWFYDQGFRVVGVEFLETAARSFFATHDLLAFEGRSAVNGCKILYTPDLMLSIYICDLYTFNKDCEGTMDIVWDRGGLVSIKEEDRKRYVALLKSLLAHDFSYALYATEYDDTAFEGDNYEITRLGVTFIERSYVRTKVIKETLWHLKKPCSQG